MIVTPPLRRIPSRSHNAGSAFDRKLCERGVHLMVKCPQRIITSDYGGCARREAKSLHIIAGIGRLTIHITAHKADKDHPQSEKPVSPMDEIHQRRTRDETLYQPAGQNRLSNPSCYNSAAKKAAYRDRALPVPLLRSIAGVRNIAYRVLLSLAQSKRHTFTHKTSPERVLQQEMTMITQAKDTNSSN